MPTTRYRGHHGGGTTKASAILAFPEGPPTDFFDTLEYVWVVETKHRAETREKPRRPACRRMAKLEFIPRHERPRQRDSRRCRARADVSVSFGFAGSSSTGSICGRLISPRDSRGRPWRFRLQQKEPKIYSNCFLLNVPPRYLVCPQPSGYPARSNPMRIGWRSPPPECTISPCTGTRS